MKNFLKKRLSVLLITVMSLSVISCPIMAEGREILLLNQTFDNFDLTSNWVTTGNTGTIDGTGSYSYVTNDGGLDSLVVPNVVVTDAVLSADFKADNFSTNTNSFFGIRMRIGENGGYQMVYYPQEKKLKLQRITANGTVDTTPDSYGYIMNEDEIYNMAFSVKDGSLRGEVNGVVWLRAFDYNSDGSPVIASGSAAVVSNLQQVTISNPKMTGEDKLFYENFESGRTFADVTTGKGYGNDGVTCETTGSISVSSGKLVLAPDGETKYPTISIKHQGSDTSNAWKNTILSFDAKSSSLELMYIYTHRINAANYAYRGFVHGNIQYSTLSKFINWSAGTSIATSSSTLDIKNTDFKFKAETKTSENNKQVDLKYYIDDTVIMSASDTEDTLASTGGGISIAPKGTLTIDNLTIKDGNATTKAETEIELKPIDKWTQGETVKGNFVEEKAYSVTSSQNGDLVLNDFSQKNVSVGMDVDIDSTSWKIGSQVVLFSRYISNGHNVRMIFSKNNTEGANPTVAILLCNSGVIKAQKYTLMSYDPGAKFRMELQAKDGMYRALIDGKVVAELTSDEEMSLKGTVGIQFKDTAATVKNVLVKDENRMWISDVPTESQKTYSFTANPDITKGIDHVAFCADIKIPDLTWNQFFMKSRINTSTWHGYSLRFRADQNNSKIYAILFDNKDGNDKIFDAEKDITSNINIGGTNRIKMETEDLSDGNVKITVLINGAQIFEYITDDTTDAQYKLTSASGVNKYDFSYPKQIGTPFTDATAWIECLGDDVDEPTLNIDYKFNNEKLVSGGEVKADLTVKNTTGEDFSAVIFAALYNADGVLCEVTPITEVTVTAQEMYKTVSTGELNVPKDPTGYRAVAYCWNSLVGMQPIFDNTVEITALEDDL